MNEYRNFDLWQEAIELSAIVHDAIITSRVTEDDVLHEQILTNVFKIPSKLAEGYCRGSEFDLAPYMEYAIRYCATTDTLVAIAHQLDFIEEKVRQNIQLRLSDLMEKLDNRQPLPFSDMEFGWHYEEEEEEEEEDNDEME